MTFALQAKTPGPSLDSEEIDVDVDFAAALGERQDAYQRLIGDALSGFAAPLRTSGRRRRNVAGRPAGPRQPRHDPSVFSGIVGTVRGRVDPRQPRHLVPGHPVLTARPAGSCRDIAADRGPAPLGANSRRFSEEPGLTPNLHITLRHWDREPIEDHLDQAAAQAACRRVGFFASRRHHEVDSDRQTRAPAGRRWRCSPVWPRSP